MFFALEKDAVGNQMDPGGRNFATLVVNHLAEAKGGGNGQWIPYPKARHTVMARTNYKAMFGSVEGSWPTTAPPNGWAEWFATKALRTTAERVYAGGYFSDELDGDLFERVMQLARLKPGEQAKDLESTLPVDQPDPNGPQPPPEFQKLPRLWNAVKKYFVPGPTVAEWLSSVSPIFGTSQTGGMEGRVAPHVPGTPKDRGMGAWKKQEKVLSRGEARDPLVETSAPIFEFRFFQDTYRVDSWPDFAAHVFDLVTWVNSKQKLTS